MRTSSSTTIEYGPQDAICPPWCAGHDEENFYQPWGELVSSGRQVRTHGEYPRDVGGVSVMLFLTEDDSNNLSAPVVEVYTEDDASTVGASASCDLTPAQARELARLLERAADRAQPIHPLAVRTLGGMLDVINEHRGTDHTVGTLAEACGVNLAGATRADEWVMSKHVARVLMA